MTVEIQLVTDDIELVAVVGVHLAAVGTLRVIALTNAGVAEPGKPPPIVLVDVRQLHAASIRRARERHPGAQFVAIVSPHDGPRELHVEGATVVVPADGATIAACCATLVRTGAS